MRIVQVLVIEDDRDARSNIVEILRSDGFEVLEAIDGESGVESALAHLPDVILCDIVMPTWDGYEVLKRLRDELTTAHIPFIFLTGKEGRSEQRRGMCLGADDYLAKPFRRHELLEMLHGQIAKQARHDRHKDSSRPPESTDQQQALQAQIQVLQLREQEIQAWVGGITHDLRAPLTTIKVALELLEHRPEKSERYLSIARQACAQSDALIEELLTLYREEEAIGDSLSKNSLSKGIHLQVIFDRLFQSFRVRSSHLNLQLQWDVPQEIDGAFSPSGLSLERILTELLNNGCKYTKVGGQIGLAVAIADGLQIKIKNQAEIDSEALPYIFNRFYRVPPDTNFPLKQCVSETPSPIPGTGLGLSLVRQLTAQLGGTLDLESSDGWTTFTLLFPL
ncbi:MAG: response regulator [Alkalinema sp. CAN_BIN05]|nr:response regulator [Alkalinema sp. CAN_BIN05]